jgi:hypothetical protein
MKHFDLDRALLRRLHRIILKTLRHYQISDCTLTLSLPPFLKLEIKAKPKSPDEHHP